MATTRLKSIRPAGGGDYTTLQAFNTAEDGDIVSSDEIVVAEVYGGGDALGGTGMSLNGWTTNPTHYIEIRAAAGEGHSGIWDTNKAYGDGGTGNQAIMAGGVTSVDLHLTRMQFVNNGSYYCIDSVGTGDHATIIDRCILKQPLAAGFGCALRNNRTSNTLHDRITNSILLTLGTQAAPIITAAGNIIDVWNCTIVTGTNTYSVLLATGAGSVINSQNNYLVASTNTKTYVELSGGAVNEGANDITSTADASTIANRNIPYSTDNFINVTSGSENLHLSDNSALKGKGADLSAYFTDDIDGETRVIPWDVGADGVAALVDSGFFSILLGSW